MRSEGRFLPSTIISRRALHAIDTSRRLSGEDSLQSLLTNTHPLSPVELEAA